jgi:hypothetical protein
VGFILLEKGMGVVLLRYRRLLLGGINPLVHAAYLNGVAMILPGLRTELQCLAVETHRSLQKSETVSLCLAIPVRKQTNLSTIPLHDDDDGPITAALHSYCEHTMATIKGIHINFSGGPLQMRCAGNHLGEIESPSNNTGMSLLIQRT